MDVEKSLWNGYEKLDFDFEDRKALLVCPKEPCKGKKWLYKTEYFDAFPEFELEMLQRGYYVAHLYNTTRWCPQEDTEIRPRFCDFLTEKFGLHKKCMPVGMSCGGMQAVYFAAKYPQYVAAMYIDAPVLNLLSCPYGLGKAHNELLEEFEEAMGVNLADLLNYREHPIDFKDKLIENNIPIFLACGDSDETVPFEENGKILADYYNANGGDMTFVLRENAGHHPHGLKDNTPLIEFTFKYY